MTLFCSFLDCSHVCVSGPKECAFFEKEPVCKAVRLAFSCRTSAISFPFIRVPWCKQCLCNVYTVHKKKQCKPNEGVCILHNINDPALMVIMQYCRIFPYTFFTAHYRRLKILVFNRNKTNCIFVYFVIRHTPTLKCKRRKLLSFTAIFCNKKLLISRNWNIKSNRTNWTFKFPSKCLQCWALIFNIFDIISLIYMV